MPETLRFAAELLAASRSGLARLAVERLMPDLDDPDRYGSDPVGLWREHLQGRLDDLGLALASDDPERFTEQLVWAKLAFAAREVPVTDLRRALECLSDVLGESLPQPSANLALAPLHAALARWEILGQEAPTTDLDAGRPQGLLSARYLMALLEGDRRRATDLVIDAVRAGELAVADALIDVCLPACRELGRMWHLDEITVAEEHVVTAATFRLLAALSALAPAAAPVQRTVFGAGLEEDDHDLGLQIVCELLELDGWNVICAGSGLPAEDVVWAVQAYDVDLLMLSATLPRHVPALGAAISALRASPRDVPVLVGGPAFIGHADAATAVGADGLAESARQVVPVARQLTGLPVSA